ncbi:hypothetical protein SAMN05216275_111153 [Streptosporangium canum]|uniref:DNA-directed RNA polymerase specialized sigma subunit, sigma24 family n=1 Tax=Streptosporangium canum TaxID=324952 RepID=A0A1I3TI78_9ACTN|nr:hypothetical protein [Streptosporangium canum]SFJ70934.1 hypothetical protein SAMN05216275_111153 [Streptosporangium canum]
MTQPLLGQRSRGELIAELYDRHAAGLFAYCHDQLGDPGSAAAALVAVLTAVPDIEPPRAALYAFARREIHLRDVVHAPPAADADPVSSFVERVLRDLRPHQREVLYLSGVCEMDTSELSWVLDVAADTADELTVSACRRFAQSLSLALPSARVPDHLAEVFGALSVAPIRDVLVRAPWATPPATLRTLALGSPSAPATAPPPPPVLQVKPLWPTAPSWPPPPAGAGARTGTGAFSPPDRFPDPFSDPFPDPFSAPEPGVVSAHEAATEPMPKLRDAILTALDDASPRARRARLQRPRPRGAAPLPAKAPQPPATQPPITQSPAESPLAAAPSPRPAAPPLPAPLPADVLDDPPAPPADVLDDPPPAPPAGLPPLEDLFRPLAPETRAALAYTDKLVAAAPREEPIPAAFATWPTPVAPPEPPDAAPVPAATGGTAQAQPPLPGWPLRPDELDGPAHQDRTPPVERPATDQRVSRPARAGRRARRRHRAAGGGHRHRHYDWIWELVGFLICVAIAMLVFFAVPTIVTP